MTLHQYSALLLLAPRLSAEFGHNGSEFGPDSFSLPTGNPGWSLRFPERTRFRTGFLISPRVNGSDETILAVREVLRKHNRPTIELTQNTGLDHVCIGPEPHLPRVSQARPSRHFNLGRKAMIEVITALLAFISIGIFLAHAFDAYRLR